MDQIVTFTEVLSPNIIMGIKKISKKPEIDMAPQVESSPNMVEDIFKHSLVSFQDEVDVILNEFGITRVEFHSLWRW